MGMDDNGNSFELSPDPLLETVCPCVADIRLDGSMDAETAESRVEELLKNDKIFGVNLYEVGMAGCVCQYFAEMLSGPGAVRHTLEKYV